MSELPEEMNDIVQVFKDAWHEADDAGAVGERTETGLQAVFRALAWEMEQIPTPPDPLGVKSQLIQHVLHRLGDQGAGHKR